MAVIAHYGSYEGFTTDPSATGFAKLPERRYARVDWDELNARGFILRVRHWGRRQGSTAVGTPRVIIDPTGAATEVVAGSVVNSTSYPNDGSEQVINVTASSGVKYYEVDYKSVANAADADNALYGYGFFETVPSGAP